jgi:CHAT domain-containing protein
MHITELVYQGNELKQELKRSLDQFIKIAAAWPQWELTNSDSLDHYYFQYTLSPFNMITQRCYQLQSEDRAKYLDLAFQSQERSKHRRLRQRMLEQSGIQDPGYASLDRVQKEMAADEAILSVSDMNGTLERSYFMVITKDTAFMMEMLDFRRFIHSYGLREPEETAFRDLSKFKKAYHQLWQLVFKPLQPYMKGIRTIRLLPSGYTSGYYFGLMIPDTTGVRQFSDIRYLRDDYRIRYDYSWTIADIRRRIPRDVSVDKRNVAFIPNYQATSYYQLKFFDAMAGKLNRDFQFRVYKNKVATVDRSLNELPSARILHLAAHGYSHNDFQYDQYIVMDSLPDRGAYLLTPHHLNRIRTNADLAVLSICMGGFSVWNHQDTRNLAYWFNYAGARSCLYSHWKIDDRSTAKILTHFYKHLSNGMDRYEALHAAQNDYLREARTDEERNPIYWGGLTMIGEDGQVPLSRRNYGWMWLFLFGVCWLLFIYRFDR